MIYGLIPGHYFIKVAPDGIKTLANFELTESLYTKRSELVPTE